jgi:hypothetical protein
MQPSGTSGQRFIGPTYLRFLVALVSASFVVLGGPSIIALLHGKAIRNPARNGQATEGRAIAYEQGKIAVTGTITDIEIAGPDVPINGFCFTMPNLWIVRLKVELCLDGAFFSPALNVLTHSPSRDLGAHSVGQRLTFSLSKASAYPSLLWPPHDPRPVFNFVGLDDLYRVWPANLQPGAM